MGDNMTIDKSCERGKAMIEFIIMITIALALVILIVLARVLL